MRKPVDTGEVSIADRPFLVLPGSVDSVRIAGSNLDLPALGQIQLGHDAYSRFELLAPGIQDSGSNELELEVDGFSNTLRLGLREGLTYTEDEERLGEDPGGRTYRLLGRHVELLGEPFFQQSRAIGGCTEVDLRDFLDDWRTSEEGVDPSLALIVRIAEQISRLIDDLCQSPRRILRRERALERAANVRQIDPAGIRWLVRQPGRNLVERAGPRQRVLAVVREESFDTLENRVLRDLLERSMAECRSWLQDNEAFETRKNKRFELVRHLGSIVRRHRRFGPVSGLPRVDSLVQANYVLQHDSRYSRIWPWYQKLRRQQVEKDNLWRWSHRTFAEAVRLSLASALDLLESEAEVPPGAGWCRDLLIRREQEHGALVDSRTRLSNWVIRARGTPLGCSLLSPTEIRELESSSNKSGLYQLAPDALVCSHSLFDRFEAQGIVLVWCRLRFGSRAVADDELKQMVERVAECSGRVVPTILLVEPGTHGDSKPMIADERMVPRAEGSPVRVIQLRVSLHLDRARDRLAEILRSAFLGQGGW